MTARIADIIALADDRRLIKLEQRMRRLPEQLTRARRRVAQLEAEARRYSMHELLTDPRHASDAFEREFAEAKRNSSEPGFEP